MRALPLLLLLAGFSSYGPKTLPRDRYDYSTAIGRSWNHELLHIMFELATQIDAPPEHQEKGYVVPPVSENDVLRLVTIESGGRPDDAFVKVKYHDHWFWIRNDDLASKRTFTFLNLLSAFVESDKPALPTLLTVPG